MDRSEPKYIEVDTNGTSGQNGQNMTKWEQGGSNMTEVDWIGQSGPMWTE